MCVLQAPMGPYQYEFKKASLCIGNKYKRITSWLFIMAFAAAFADNIKADFPKYKSTSMSVSAYYPVVISNQCHFDDRRNPVRIL